tara:strand:- start:12 stop:407 length:396 start_codon:yes stop_codon:yes gene_type:complete
MFLGVYFAYKGFIAYFIHKELYGGGIDALVASRWGLAAALILLAFLLLFFIRIKDLKSHKTILNGIFICWASVCVTLLIVATSSIYFIVLTGLASLISLVSSKGLVKKIKEERETLSEKEVYLLQQLAKKK